MLYSQATKQFLELRTPIIRPATIEIYKRAFNLWNLPDRELNTYTKLDVQHFINTLLNKGMSRASVNIYLRSLKAFGRWCVEMELLQERNAFSTIKQLKVDEKEIEFLTREQFQSILDFEPRKMLKNIYIFATLTGLRLSTILSIKWKQIDIDNRLIIIENIDTFKTKTGKNQIIPLHPLLIEILTNNKTNGEYVFCKTSSLIPSPLTADYVSHCFKRSIRKAGLDDKFHFHSLRKTYGTWLLKSGASIYEVSKLLGHSSVVVTTMHYASLSTSEMHDVVEKITL